MNIASPPPPIKSETKHTPSARHLATIILPWTLAGLLFLSNIGTLLSDRARSIGHDGLVSIMTAVFGDSISEEESRAPATAAQTADGWARQALLLAERSKELQSTIATLRRENRQATTQKVEADSRFQKLQAEHADLTNKHMALEKDQRVLKEMSARRAKTVRTVADRISRKLAIHAGELIAELPLRAAPYVGVFTLVTGTALDIKSDCELASALNGLVLEHQEAAVDTHAVCQYTDRIPPAARVWDEVKGQAGVLAAPVYQAVERLYRH